MSLQDWVQAITLLFLVLSFLHRLGLAKRSDITDLKTDLKDILTEARRTNGRLTTLETWRDLREKDFSARPKRLSK